MDIDSETLAEELGEAVAGAGLTLAVAESLTAGRLAASIAVVGGSADWFRGGVVAYQPETKFSVLRVTPGDVATELAATEMALGVAHLMSADVALAVTGIGGPEHQHRPAGTVFVAAVRGSAVEVERHQFVGSPDAVIRQTITAALKAGLRMVNTA